MIYPKKIFVLTKDNLIELCEYYLKSHKDLDIQIEQSPNKKSNSFYLRFYIGDKSASLRVSDHDTSLTKIGGGIRNVIVCKNTHCHTLINAFNSTLHSLNYKIHAKNIISLYDKIEKESSKDK